METQIGDAAGLIWRYLSQEGEMSLAKLKQGTRLSDQLLCMGLGWLAREGKVHLIKDKRALRAGLTAG